MMLEKFKNLIFKLKQQKWTHISMWLYVLLVLTTIFSLPFIFIYSVNIKSELVSLLNLFYIFSQYTIILVITFAFFLFFVDKICRCQTIKNKFFLYNKKYHIFWLFGFLLTIISYILFIINKITYFIFFSNAWKIGRFFYPIWFNRIIFSTIAIITFYLTFIALKKISGDNDV